MLKEIPRLKHTNTNNFFVIAGPCAIEGRDIAFEIAEEVDVCHADVVINSQQLLDMQYDATLLEEILPCDVPKANPKHAEMLASLEQFMMRY